MRKLLARLLGRRPARPAAPPPNEMDRLLRIYAETLKEMQDLRRAA